YVGWLRTTKKFIYLLLLKIYELTGLVLCLTMSKKPINTIVEAPNPINTLDVRPKTRYPILVAPAAVNAYGICVVTWSIKLHSAPTEERIVESEIGET